jgi:hypothetical protein
MFIRWQVHKSAAQIYYKRREVSFRAVLAETKRVNGVPRQRHIAYLGSITEEYTQVLAQRCYFWDKVTTKLKALSWRIPPATMPKLEAALAVKVPRPSKKEYKKAARECARLLGWKWLSKGFKAALADEADRWKNCEGESFDFGTLLGKGG